MHERRSTVHIFLACRCGARHVVMTEAMSAANDVDDSGWKAATLKDEAAGVRDTCPACLAAATPQPRRRRPRVAA